MEMHDLINISTLDSVCMTFEHSYGLMSKEEQEAVQKVVGGIYWHHVKVLAERIEELEEKLKNNSFDPDNISEIIICGLDKNGKEFKTVLSHFNENNKK